MISTRFGTIVEVLGGDVGTGAIDWRRVEESADVLHRGFICDFKADGGASEIIAAIDVANARGED